ncbi:Hypothetical protein ETEE_1669 [Edwardsiella anguillarum ET080813]|uniref:Uncharacterized protein n=1 Tax=Edwardsiella anguillarum ET080813 TaxID=667120 RepID=A0A076LNC1_9GAMM|nr:Hypothetical protein ETEE_1669 [Edwardsiella anguillarum ET080813]
MARTTLAPAVGNGDGLRDTPRLPIASTAGRGLRLLVQKMNTQFNYCVIL